MPITITSVLPYFAIMAMLLGFAEILARTVPFYKRLLGAQQRGRYESLDGLRGFLALGVFFAHSVLHYFFLQTGRWEAPPHDSIRCSVKKRWSYFSS